MKLEDLPEYYQKQIRDRLAAEKAHRKPQDAFMPPPVKADARKPRTRRSANPATSCGRHDMSETEKRYQRDVLHGLGRYESLILRLPGGSRYTPDFLTVENGRVILHEVKGAYRLGSEGRAATAYRECVAAFPMFEFRWAKWDGKNWRYK